MSPASLIGSFLLWTTLAGLLGAVAMLVVLWGFTRSGLANVRLLVAVGSLLTRSYENAPLVGGAIHIFAGVFFAQIYAFLMIAVDKPGLGPNLMWGAALGTMHGLIMSLVLIAAVAEAHPLEEFRKRSFTIALCHWVGHVAYGLVVGAVIGLSGLVVAR
jgi:hypothetical protein